MISASHNPAADNGIKLFGAGGMKLDEDVEAAIEARLGRQTPTAAGGRGRSRVPICPVTPSGTSTPCWPRCRIALDGLRVVVDCANGAAAAVAEAVYSRAGADVTVINTELVGRAHQRGVRCDASRGLAGRGASLAAPMSGSPTTATPIAASR